MYYEVRCGTCNDIMIFKNIKDFIKHKHQYGCNCQQKEIKISDASYYLRDKILENEPGDNNLRNLEPKDVETLVGWLREYYKGCADMKSALDLINERIQNGIEYRKELVKQMNELERRKEELQERIREIDKEEDELLLAIDKLKG